MTTFCQSEFIPLSIDKKTVPLSVIVLIIFEEVLGPDLNNTFVPVVSTFIGYVS